MGKSKTPVWAWIGCGCLLCIFLFFAVIGGIGLAGVSFVKGMVEDMADPASRTASVLELLGAEALPEGYVVRAVLKIPFIMQVAILSDGEPLPAVEGEDFEEKAQQLENLVLRSDQLGDNTIIYLKLRDRKEDLHVEDLLSGRAHGNANVDLGVRFESVEEVSEGKATVGAQPLTWRAFEGAMEVVGGEEFGVFAAVQVACAGGEIHDVLWFQKSGPIEEKVPDDGSVPDVNAAVARLAGTPADPEALRGLFEHFSLCKP